MRVMFAIPFSVATRSRATPIDATCVLPPSVQDCQQFIVQVERAGFDVDCPLAFAEWKNVPKRPGPTLRNRLHYLRRCEHFIAIAKVAVPCSDGVPFLIGAATALDKPMTLLVQGTVHDAPWWLDGLRRAERS